MPVFFVKNKHAMPYPPALARICCFLLFFSGAWLHAQQNFSLTRFPQDNQLLPRNVGTGKGVFFIEGWILKAAPYDAVTVKIFRDTSFYSQQTSSIVFTSDTFKFRFPVEIPAELKNYRLELSTIKNGQATLARKAERIVAGDVILVNGQSNNIGSIEDPDQDDFLRSHTVQFGWNNINYTQPGKWPPRLAKSIIRQNHIPVALFNESVGGETEDYYLKKNSSLTDGVYGDAYQRMAAAEVAQQVRAIFWWQGESDGWVTNPDTFKLNFKQLVKDWAVDYPGAQVYYYQIRFRSCAQIRPEIMDEQRQAAKEINGVELMSVTAAESNGCHFYYNNGYDSIGNRAYRLFASKNYGGSSVNVRPPMIDSAWFGSKNEVVLHFKNLTGSLAVVGSPWSDFVLNGGKAQITGGRASGLTASVFISGDTSGLTSISYLAHIDTSNNWLVNPLGVGALTFLDVPILRNVRTGVTDPTANAPIRLYPTLTEDFFEVVGTNESMEPADLKIFDLAGRLMSAQKLELGSEPRPVSIQNLPAGYYLVDLRGTGWRKAFKITKL